MPGHGWASVAPQLNLPHVKMVFPTAPNRPISVNGGMRMPGWFDIHALDASTFQAAMKGIPMDAAGVDESVAYISGLLDDEERAGVQRSRIVLGGFSQGGNIALKVATRSRGAHLAGVVGLSTWMEPDASDAARATDATRDVPIFLGHGSADPLVPAFAASATLAALEGQGYAGAKLKVYPGMQHSTCQQELDDLRAFLATTLPPQQPTR